MGDVNGDDAVNIFDLVIVAGKVIYTEPIPNYLEGTSRRVSIEVYDDPDLFGDATMYVVGELDPNEVEVPTEWYKLCSPSKGQ